MPEQPRTIGDALANVGRSITAMTKQLAPPPPPPPPPVSALSRLKLTEPVRLYCYTVLLVLTAAAQLAGWLTGEWADFLAANGAVVLAVGAGAEAARASVYSPRSVVQAVRRAAGQ